MGKISISGLVISLTAGRSIYLTRQDGTAVVVEVTLKAANPANQCATLAIMASGEKTDIGALGLPSSPFTTTISSKWVTEVLPGVLIAIRNGNRFFSPRVASLVIDAPRELWTIQRDRVVDRELLKQARLLQFRNRG